VVIGNDFNDPTNVWQIPVCGSAINLVDEGLPISGSSAAGSGIHLVGSQGGVLRYPGGSCFADERPGAPPARLFGVFATGGNRAWAVGDEGTLLYVHGQGADTIPNEINRDFKEVWRTNLPRILEPDDPGPPIYDERLWIVGATGSIVKAGYFFKPKQELD